MIMTMPLLLQWLLLLLVLATFTTITTTRLIFVEPTHYWSYSSLHQLSQKWTNRNHWHRIFCSLPVTQTTV